ncbi:MAG TPA: SAM-dependent methyltransferase [Verrucomicrobia subdivision 3 bacterium]|nr:SAM-dependent methyltransferase [Limisphaerales bacterium]
MLTIDSKLSIVFDSHSILMMNIPKQPNHQVLPPSGPEREALREKGQFWTPQWLAKIMAAWVVAKRPSTLFDPAVGPGTFFAAAREAGFTGDFAGFEVDDVVLAESYKLGLNPSELHDTIIGDFISQQIMCCYPAIISNPPYIRHHRLSAEQKKELRQLSKHCLGFSLDGRVGLHIYFLLKCLDHLAPDGRLAFLLPADVCEGVSSTVVWKRLAEKFRINAVITFDKSAAPFPSVDTNAMVFLISHRQPSKQVRWLRVVKPDSEAIMSALDETATEGSDALTIQHRNLDELLATGLSRPLRAKGSAGVPLSAFARVVRGIATGANEFFFLTAEQIRKHDLDKSYFKRAIGRTRDCPRDVITWEDLENLDRAGRPTWMLSLGRESEQDLPATLRDYLKIGKQMGLPQRSLIETRKPWYRMEERTVPGLLFAYLGRRDCRFILNRSGAVPLTGFLCVFPWDESEAYVRKLWRALNHEDTQANLVFVGKSYGGGALKVEPRRLDALEIPEHVLKEVGLTPVESWSPVALLETSHSKSKRRISK